MNYNIFFLKKTNTNNSEASIDVPILEIFQTKFSKDHHRWNQYWSIAMWSQTMQIWDNNINEGDEIQQTFK